MKGGCESRGVVVGCLLEELVVWVLDGSEGPSMVGERDLEPGSEGERLLKSGTGDDAVVRVARWRR